MAVTTEWTVPQTSRTVYSGLSSDSKPSNPVAGSIFYETDTNDFYYFDGAAWTKTGTDGAAHVDASPDGHAVTQHDSTDDPNGPFCGLRFDAAGTVHLISGGVEHILTVVAAEYFPGVVTRVNSTDTTLTDAQMIGFKRV